MFRVPRLPQPGESVLADAPRRFLGGKGANQAIAAARSGAKVSVIGAVGRDKAGDEFIACFRKEGIDTSNIVRVAEPTGIAAVTVGPDGLNQISIHPGANMALPVATVENAAIQAEDFVLGQLEVPDPCLLAASRRGRFVLNPAPYRTFEPELRTSVEICIPNETEAFALTGIEPIDKSAMKASAELISAAITILTLGPRGACLLAEGTTQLFPAPDVSAIDSTAAGDVFCGSLVAQLSLGANLREAVDWAVAAASLSVTRPGAINSIPTADEVTCFRERI